MRTINFNRAYEKVGDIAKSVGKKYYSVSVDKDPHNGVEIRGYIDGYTWTDKCTNLKDLIKAVNVMVSPKTNIKTEKVINVK